MKLTYCGWMNRNMKASIMENMFSFITAGPRLSRVLKYRFRIMSSWSTLIHIFPYSFSVWKFIEIRVQATRIR